jgi:hypothetical protein
VFPLTSRVVMLVLGSMNAGVFQEHPPEVATTVSNLCDLLSDLTSYRPDPLLLLPDNVVEICDGKGLANEARTKLILRLVDVEDGLPNTEKAWVMHAIVHVIDSIQMWNSVRETWCWYGERMMRYAKSLTRNYRHCEQSFLSSLGRSNRAFVHSADQSQAGNLFHWNIATNPLHWEGNEDAQPVFENSTRKSQMKQRDKSAVREGGDALGILISLWHFVSRNLY